MKRIIFIAFFLFTGFVAVAQDFELSNDGMTHWLEANALLENVQHPADFLKAAQEMEKVVATDPDVPEVYYNLGIMFGKYAEMVGKNLGRIQPLDKLFQKVPHLQCRPTGAGIRRGGD